MTDEDIIKVVERHCQEYDARTGRKWMSYSRAKVINIIRELEGDAVTLLRELNDALVIPRGLQPRVDAVLDRAEEKCD